MMTKQAQLVSECLKVCLANVSDFVCFYNDTTSAACHSHENGNPRLKNYTLCVHTLRVFLFESVDEVLLLAYIPHQAAVNNLIVKLRLFYGIGVSVCFVNSLIVIYRAAFCADVHKILNIRS
jgi:hypothetical protein